MGDRDKNSEGIEAEAAAGASWTVRGIDAGSREIAAAAARSGDLPVGAWVDRAILRATRQAPEIFAEGAAAGNKGATDIPEGAPAPDKPATETDDPTGLLRTFAELDARHAEAEARFTERLHALRGDVEGLAQGIDSLSGRGATDRAAGDAPPDAGEPPPVRLPRSRGRGLAVAAAWILLVAALGGGGWVFLALTEPPTARKPAPAPPEVQTATAAREPAAQAAPDPVDRKEDRLEEAARGGDAKAQHDLALRLASGNGAAPDYEAAARWFTAAALQGLPNAQYNLGVLYEKGLGVERNDREAWVWYRNAAEAGHGQAQYNLGVSHAQGRGMPRNDAEAVRWFRRAADQGIAEAHFNLALLLEKGRGIGRDLDAARRHYLEAAAGGVDDARGRLAALDSAGTSDTADGATGGGVPPRTTAPVLGRREIVEIQTLLAALDFDPGPADGNFGARSRDAARLFQQFAGLPETGEPSRALLEELRAVSGLAPR